MKIELKVWLGKDAMKHIKPEDIGTEKAQMWVSFSNGDMDKFGYTLVGRLEGELTMFDRDVVVGNAIVAMQTQIKEIKLKATIECSAIDNQIQQLLCIENQS